MSNISKKYRIGVTQQYHTLRDSLMRITKRPLDIFKQRKVSADGLMEDEFWALKDISFDVIPGEVLGIIGRNGAGKSTLLKILSRITPPTSGKIILRGRIASLLEVGTGFNQELTGRENIFLNGAILGMKNKEIRRKFDEIVDFSEIEKFLDTPVKFYSSGMYTRLAFAVAAHLDPEIMIIDEVLAVGDAEFQKKCLGKIGDIAKGGRTVIFVSHNLEAVKRLCKRCILLEVGKIKHIGDVGKAVKIYLDSKSSHKTKEISLADRKRNDGLSLRAKIMDIHIINKNSIHQEILDSVNPLIIRLSIFSDLKEVKCSVQLVIKDEMQNLSVLDSGTMHNKIYKLKKGLNEIECHIKSLNLYAGNYSISCALTVPGQEVIDFVEDAYFFTIRDFDPYKSGYNLQKSYGFGIFNIDHEWKSLTAIK